VVFVGEVVGGMSEYLGDLLKGVVVVVWMRRPALDVAHDLGEEVGRRLGDRVGRRGVSGCIFYVVHMVIVFKKTVFKIGVFASHRPTNPTRWG